MKTVWTPTSLPTCVFAAIDRGEYWIVPQPEMLDPLLKARNKLIETRADPVFAWTQETVE
jgi:hypothetical protein